MPRNCWSSLIFWGGFISLIASTFSGSGFTPSLDIICPRNFTCRCLKLILLRFNFKFFSLQRSNNLFSLISWSYSAVLSLSPDPYIITSSAHIATPSKPSSASFILRWYSSGAEETPNGSLLHLYLPNGVTKVVNKLDSLSSSTCQNPLLASTTLNIRALLRLGKIYSMLFNI